MTRCLVLGGCGFIGSHLADKLVGAGMEVRLFDKLNVDTSRVAHLGGSVEIVEGDFTNESEVSEALRGMDVVYHLVSTTLPATSNQNPAYDVESNVVSTLRMLDAAREAKIGKVIFSSSGGTVYGPAKTIPIPEDHPANPVCSYGVQKLTIEKYLALYGHLHNLDWTVLRPANPYGERQDPTSIQGAVGVFAGAIREKRSVEIWGDGSVIRDYIHVEDVAEAFALFADRDGPSHIYNIGTGVGTDLNELIKLMTKACGVEPEVKYLPGRKVDIPVNVLDITLARTELGWEPGISLEEGLDRLFRGN